MSIVNDYIDGYSGYVKDSTNKLPYNRLANLQKGSETWRDFLKFMFTEEATYNLDHNGIRETDFPNGWESVAGFLNDKIDLDSQNPYRVAFHSLDFNDNVDVAKADFLTRYLEEKESREDQHWNESLAFWIDFYKEHFDLQSLIDKESEVEYNEDGTVKDSHGAIANGSSEGKYNFRINDVLFGDAGNSFELNEEWVKSWFNIDGDTYKLVREGNTDGGAPVYDNILQVLTDYRELQFTRFPDTEAMAKAFYRTDKEEREETFKQMQDYLRLIMPKYLRRVEIEDLDRNFWVIAQVISALSAYLFDEDNLQKYLQGLMDEIVQLWENIPYLWAEFGMLNTSTKYEDIQAMMIPVQASAIMRGPIFDNIGRENTIGTVVIDEDYDYEAAYQMLVNSWEKLSYLKDLYSESNLLIVPEIRDYNYHKNYYARAYYPGIIEYDRNTDKMKYIVFNSDDTREFYYKKYLDTDKSIYYFPDANNDGNIDYVDASLILAFYSSAAAGGIRTLDVDEDGNPLDEKGLLACGECQIPITEDGKTIQYIYKVLGLESNNALLMRDKIALILSNLNKTLQPYIGNNTNLYREQYLDCKDNDSDYTYEKEEYDFPLYEINQSNYYTIDGPFVGFLLSLYAILVSKSKPGTNIEIYIDQAVDDTIEKEKEYEESPEEHEEWSIYVGSNEWSKKYTTEQLKQYILEVNNWVPYFLNTDKGLYMNTLIDSQTGQQYRIPSITYANLLQKYIKNIEESNQAAQTVETEREEWEKVLNSFNCVHPESITKTQHYLCIPNIYYAQLVLYFIKYFKDQDEQKGRFVVDDTYENLDALINAETSTDHEIKSGSIYELLNPETYTNSYTYYNEEGEKVSVTKEIEVRYLMCTKPRYVLIDDIEHPGNAKYDIYLIKNGNNTYIKYFYDGTRLITDNEIIEINDIDPTSDEMTPNFQYLSSSDGADWYSFAEMKRFIPNAVFPYCVDVEGTEIESKDFRKVPLNIDLTKKTDKFDIYNYCTAMYEDEDNYYFCPSFSEMDSDTYYNTTTKTESITKTAHHEIYVDSNAKEYSGYYYPLIRPKFHNFGDKLEYKENGIWWKYNGTGELTSHTLLISFQDAIKEFFGDKIDKCDNLPEDLEQWYIQHEYDTSKYDTRYSVININFERRVDFYRNTQEYFDKNSTKKGLKPIKKTDIKKGYDRGELLSYQRFIQRDKIKYKTESQILSYGPLNMLGSSYTLARAKYASADETGMNNLIADLNAQNPDDSSNYVWDYYDGYIHTCEDGKPKSSAKEEGSIIRTLRTKILKDKEFYAKIVLLKAVVPYDDNDYNMEIGRGKFECLPFAAFIWSTGKFASSSTDSDDIKIYSKILPIKAYGHPQCKNKTYSSTFPYPYISSEHNNKWANATQMLGLTPTENISIDIDKDKKITRKINTNSSFKVNKPCYCSKEWTENCSTFGNLQGSEVSFSVEAFDKLQEYWTVSLDKDFVIYAADSSYCLSSKADGTLKYYDMVPYYYDCSIIQENGIYKVKAVYYSQVADTKGGYYVPKDNYGYNIDNFKYTDDFKEYIKELV